MIRLRTPSIKYETGFAVAATRNQSISIRSRGMFIEEMNRKTKNAGKRPWTASPEPVRSAAVAPIAPKPSRINPASNSSTIIPSTPAWKSTPIASPTPR
jgi:hypothetical protein